MCTSLVRGSFSRFAETDSAHIRQYVRREFICILSTVITDRIHIGDNPIIHTADIIIRPKSISSISQINLLIPDMFVSRPYLPVNIDDVVASRMGVPNSIRIQSAR